jgi:SAM-dependent methyltransferase
MDSTARFSDRVENYVRYRPGYPEQVVETLAAEAGLTAESIIADIGSGTGISSEPFLRHGSTVYGVEPNEPMRAAAERLLAGYPRFQSVAGTAEATTLPADSVDYVVAGQAFHWFDRERARQEFARILRAGGWVVLLFNTRLVDASPFLQAYEQLLHEFATDYAQVDHRNVNEDRLRTFFRGEYRTGTFPNHQDFDYDGLRGRLLSSSYVPNAGHPGYRPMLAALERIFTSHQQDGRVRFEYRTEMHFGHLRTAAGDHGGD